MRHETPDSVTLTLRANRAWEGFRAGQFIQVAVEIDGVRRTRCYSPASAAGTAPRARADRQVPSRGPRLQLPDRARAARDGARPRAGRRRLPPSRRAARARPSDQRRQRHHPGDVDAADALRRGSSGPGHLPALRARPRARDLPRRARADRRGRVPTFAWSAPTRGRRAPGRQTATSARPSSSQCEPDYARAETFACGPPALLDAVRETWAADGLESRLHVESFVPPTLAPPSGVAGGLDPLRRLRPAARQQRRLAARAGRGRRAHPRDRLPHGHLPHLHLPQDERARSRTSQPARSPRTRTRRSRSASRHRSATSSSSFDQPTSNGGESHEH